MLRRINQALPELLAGILLYGLLLQVTGIWFVGDKIFHRPLGRHWAGSGNGSEYGGNHF